MQNAETLLNLIQWLTRVEILSKRYGANVKVKSGPALLIYDVQWLECESSFKMHRSTCGPCPSIYPFGGWGRRRVEASPAILDGIRYLGQR